MEFKDKIKSLREQAQLTLEEVAQRVGVSAPTIMRYESGEIQNMRRDKIVKLAEALNTTPSYLMDWDDAPHPALKPIQHKRIPHLGKIACGEPIFITEDHAEYVYTDLSGKADFTLTAVGDSMSGANINDGDTVYIHSQSMVNNGEIAAVIIGDEALLKRVYFENEVLMLVSENPKYMPRTYTGDSLSDVRIIGKAVSCQFKIK